MADSEVMKVPKNFQFSRENFTPLFFPEDSIPLLPCYATYKARLDSFATLTNSCPDEIEELARTGFYYTKKTGLYCPKGEEELIPYEQALCFCCGSKARVLNVYPRKTPVKHHLHCKFFSLPEGMEHIKEGIKPVRREDYTWERVDEERRERCPGRIFKDDDRTKLPLPAKKCMRCKKDVIQVLIYPCYHSSCIACAKRDDLCPRCHIKYTGLQRML